MKYTRFTFLLVIVVLASLLAISAVGAQDMEYSESPMLTEMVDAGELSPVAERLPVNPAVVTPANEVGTYGGEMRVGFVGTNPGWGGMWYVAGWENLIIWESDFSGVAPNIAESWEVSDDVTEYTFYLREGIKWSDGVEFTADDILFYIEDILFNEELSAAGPIADWLPRDGAEEFVAEKIDDYTIKFTFAQPYGTFLFNIPTWSGRHLTFFPKHYLSQFHADYNENVADLVSAEEGVEDWIGLFNKKAAGPSDDLQNYFNEPERPVLFPWVVTEPIGAGTQMRMARNPYYWKVDTEGNQLPYIDNIVGISYQEGENRTLAMLNGDLDYIKDAPGDARILFFDALDQGAPIRISAAVSDGGNTNSIHFNRTTDDPVLAEIFANKDFRIGMSHAINREEIIEIVHFGQGTPAQVAPLESSPLYNEQLATQYLEFNVDLANEYLDMVMPDKDDEGFRLRPDGERFTAVFSVPNNLSYGTSWVQTAELLIGYWEEVGVDVVLNAMADEVYTANKDENELQITLYTGEGGAGITGILDPRYYVPMEHFGMFGNGWYNWRIDLTDSVRVEPPQEIIDYRAMYEEVLATAGQDAQIAQMAEVLQIAAEEFWVVGISRPAPGYQPYHERLGNQPDSWIAGWIEGVQKIKYPEQWYIIQ